MVWIARPELGFDILGALTSLGNPFAWKVVLSFYTWALLSQKVPGSKTFCGPPAPHGFIPEYAANGFQYYWSTLAAFLLLCHFYPGFCLDVYDNFGPIVQVITKLVMYNFSRLVAYNLVLILSNLDALRIEIMLVYCCFDSERITADALRFLTSL